MQDKSGKDTRGIAVTGEGLVKGRKARSKKRESERQSSHVCELSFPGGAVCGAGTSVLPHPTTTTTTFPNDSPSTLPPKC